MIALGQGGTDLSLFDATTLLDATVVGLDHPGELGVVETLELRHPEVAGSPVLNVTVWGDQLEDFDEAIAFEMDDGARSRQFEVWERSQAGAIGVKRRLLRSWISQRQPKVRSSLSLSRLAYQLSKRTHAGVSGRFMVARPGDSGGRRSG